MKVAGGAATVTIVVMIPVTVEVVIVITEMMRVMVLLGTPEMTDTMVKAVVMPFMVEGARVIVVVAVPCIVSTVVVMALQVGTTFCVTSGDQNLAPFDLVSNH